MLIILFSTVLVSCSDDDKNNEDSIVADLKLSESKVKVEEEQTVKIDITSGSEHYKAESKKPKIAKAEIQDKQVIIKGLKEGKTKVTVTDTETEKTVEIRVKVISKYDAKVLVKAGTFTMGSPEDEADRDDDEVQHEVTLSKDFYISKYEVTNAQYAKFLNAKGNQEEEGVTWLAIDSEQIEKDGEVFKAKEGKENYPVMLVSWYGAKAYCEWVGGQLPTEAQWEYAARGGHKATTPPTLYAGSNIIDDVAWYDQNSEGATHIVGAKNANELGLHDMTGNVYEWCNDWYGAYPTDAVTDPVGADTGTYRVVRGGSWYGLAEYGRVANRGGNEPVSRALSVGFRVVFPK